MKKQVFFGLIAAIIFLTPLAASAATTSLVGLPVSGATDAGDRFNGTLDITSFEARNGLIHAIGTLTGALVSPTGDTIGTVTERAVTLPLASTVGSACPVLHLDLGPLSLDLLGLQIHLNRVILDITAAPGPGNVLGNLLCSVIGLLEMGAPLSIIIGILNAIVAILGSL